MPAQRPPSLLALRAFEAAARRLSFTEAARELHVSQAAISRHVRGLEKDIGRELFRRLHRAVEIEVFLGEVGQRGDAEVHRAHARLFLTLKALGKLDELQNKVFQEIHVEHQPLFAPGDPLQTQREACEPRTRRLGVPISRL